MGNATALSSQTAPPAPGGFSAAALFAPGSGAGAPPAASVQALVDQAASLNLYSLPDPAHRRISLFAPGSRVPVGLAVHENLHRLQIYSRAPTTRSPLTGRRIVGDLAAHGSHRWLFMPDTFSAAPGLLPPPTPFDRSRSQRFVMLDSLYTFGDGEDGFRGFGTGCTFASTDGSSRLLVTAIGSILEGFGAFAGHSEGTYLYCGTLDAERGFTGNVMLRIMDPQQSFWTDSELSEPESIVDPEPDITYLLFRGEAVASDAVTPRIGPGGQFLGLTVEQGLRLLETDFRFRGHSLRATTTVGKPIGRITSTINFNPASPGGDTLHPIPFTNFDQFIFQDAAGNPAGSFTGNSSEGRVFLTLVGGQPAIRFGGTGSVLQGVGPFRGVNGLLTDNSLVVFSPHVSASIYLLRIHDPEGRFRFSVGK